MQLRNDAAGQHGMGNDRPATTLPRPAVEPFALRDFHVKRSLADAVRPQETVTPTG